MNVEKDIAICYRCDEAFQISKLLGISPPAMAQRGWTDSDSASFNINDPPGGVSYENYGMGWRIATTTRSWGALFLVPFMCVWSGFSLGGIYGSQIAEGEFDLLRSLFGIPFLLGTILFGSMALMSCIGRMVIASDEMDHDAGTIFFGVGPIGLTKRFRWSEITGIDETLTNGRKSRSPQITLYRDSGDINIGSMLTEKRRRYVLRALRQLVTRQG